MDARNLNDVVDALTRGTVQRIERDDPADPAFPSLVRTAPLLEQLRQAMRPGMEGGAGGSGGSPSKAPMALNAFDLYREIDEVATFQYWTNKGNQPLRSFALEDRIRYWAVQSLVSKDKTREAAKIMAGWIASIEALFNPAKRVTIPGKCPACQARHYTAVEDGEVIRKPALTAVLGSQGTFATCGNCNTRWAGPEIHALAEGIRSPHPAVP